MLATVVVYRLSGASHRLSSPQSYACLQQSLALVVCEIEKRPRLFILSSLSGPESQARTGLTSLDSVFSHAPRANHDRRTIRERSRSVGLGKAHRGSVLGGSDRRDHIVADSLRVGTIMVGRRGFDTGRGAGGQSSGRKISTQVGI
jgi:hypothetical protein